MNVTINTDASFNKKKKNAAYAFWIKCNLFTIKKYGKMKKKCKDPTDAELKCIVNALHTLIAQNVKITNVFINTDSMNSIHVISNNEEMIAKYDLKKFEYIRNMITKMFKRRCVKIIPRHVKAHSGTNTPRKYINDWCDRQSRKANK